MFVGLSTKHPRAEVSGVLARYGQARSDYLRIRGAIDQLGRGGLSMDPGPEFWLCYIDHRGGPVEPAADGTLVMLPPAMADEFDLPDELVVTADPNVARDGGMVLLATGHPALIQAADETLTGGDAGVVALAAPSAPVPNREQLQDKLRDQIAVQYGRIDVTGLPVRIDRIMRVGALVTYTAARPRWAPSPRNAARTATRPHRCP